MSSTKLNGASDERRNRKRWLRAATAISLLAGTATMTMAASRGSHRATTAPARMAVSFNWRTYAPGRLVRLDPAPGGNGSVGDMNTEGLRAPAVTFAWQTFKPGHIVHLDAPGGSGASSAGNTQTDALRAPAVGFNWRTFAPGHIVPNAPSNAMKTSAPGGLHTDALHSAVFRPTLVYGLGRTETGGFRAEMGLIFRMR